MTSQVPVFTFAPRWKEELVCTCAQGSFVLEMTMGGDTVYLPPGEKWRKLAPEWAKEHWSTLHEQLAKWCAGQRIPLRIDDTATVNL
ncbi:MAG: hypothetical protein P4L83_24930 [Nevskia sp.]|nr:hypothetical protein [Nevskia sp.]